MGAYETTRIGLLVLGVATALLLLAPAGGAQNLEKGDFDGGNFDGGNFDGGDGGDGGSSTGADQVLSPCNGCGFGASVDANGGTTAGKTLVATSEGAPGGVFIYHLNDVAG